MTQSYSEGSALSIGETVEMESGVTLKVVAGQGEADVICSILRAEGIKCSERLADSAESGFSREMLVAPSDLAWARELLAIAESYVRLKRFSNTVSLGRR